MVSRVDAWAVLHRKRLSIPSLWRHRLLAAQVQFDDEQCALLVSAYCMSSIGMDASNADLLADIG